MQHEQTISIKQEDEDEASLVTTDDIVVRSFIKKKNMRVQLS